MTTYLRITGGNLDFVGCLLGVEISPERSQADWIGVRQLLREAQVH
jgi:hypothetical protein